MELEEFSFELPEELIARYPANKRDESRLMIVDRKSNHYKIEPYFKNIFSYLREGDVIIYNSARVSKRRVYLFSEKNREHECVFLEKKQTGQTEIWKCLLRNSAKLKKGDDLKHPEEKMIFKFLGTQGEGFAYLITEEAITEEFFERAGNIPIPPYLKRRAEEMDTDRYQTIFADKPGSVAAPTAGLHFSEELKKLLAGKGVQFSGLELKVGYGTFAPLTIENITDRKLHSEEFYVPKETLDLLNESKGKRRIISLGTTSLRVLETIYSPASGLFELEKGFTDIFITPEEGVKSADGLITNFHLPESSLLILVCAFAGTGLALNAYNHAVEEKMRFFSYGDCMFIS